jgi:hypothetical protein
MIMLAKCLDFFPAEFEILSENSNNNKKMGREDKPKHLNKIWAFS